MECFSSQEHEISALMFMFKDMYHIKDLDASHLYVIWLDFSYSPCHELLLTSHTIIQIWDGAPCGGAGTIWTKLQHVVRNGIASLNGGTTPPIICLIYASYIRLYIVALVPSGTYYDFNFISWSHLTLLIN